MKWVLRLADGRRLALILLLLTIVAHIGAASTDLPFGGPNIVLTIAAGAPLHEERLRIKACRPLVMSLRPRWGQRFSPMSLVGSRYAFSPSCC